MSANLLHREASPYLRQHADNPVHWRPWGAEALAEAARLDRPILLSVGYAACHWCHVMAHESFEDPETAAVMNRLFVNIKVDREERPDIDQIYMAALQALGEQGGWPLTMFLTPAGEPIWGGTYFPKATGFGRPAFTDVLQSVAHTFAAAPDRVEGNRTALLDFLRAVPNGEGTGIGSEAMDEAAAMVSGVMDPVNGGLGGAPKFPQPTLLAFLCRSAERAGRPDYARQADHALRRMLQGGIYDHVGGGLHRYSVDERWLVPHFEKMLYDNALMIDRATSAWLRTGDVLFRLQIEQTVDWLFREMRVGEAFAASLDADTAEGEGAFYTWRPDEVAAVLGPEPARAFCRAYDITDAGNFEGRSIPNRLAPVEGPDDDEIDARADQRAALLAARDQRPRPARDDKILSDWNGLAIAALARTGAVFGRTDWLDAAAANYRFITESMVSDGRLRHSRLADTVLDVGFASDYGAMIRAAIALHQATLDAAYLDDARRLAETLDRHYWDDAASAWRLSADDAGDLIVRPLPLLDESVPGANAVIAEARLRLASLTGDALAAQRADAVLKRHLGTARDVFGKAGLFNALDQRLAALDVVLVRPPGADIAPWLAAVRLYLTEASTLLAIDDGDALPENHPAIGKRAQGGSVTAYVCRGSVCSAPVTDPAELPALLRPAPASPAA